MYQNLSIYLSSFLTIYVPGQKWLSRYIWWNITTQRNAEKHGFWHTYKFNGIFSKSHFWPRNISLREKVVIYSNRQQGCHIQSIHSNHCQGFIGKVLKLCIMSHWLWVMINASYLTLDSRKNPNTAGTLYSGYVYKKLFLTKMAL